MSLWTALIVSSQFKVLVGDKKKSKKPSKIWEAQPQTAVGGWAPWPQRRTAPGKTPCLPLLRVLQTDWLCAIERDLKPLNVDLHSALPQVADRSSWRRILDRCVLGFQFGSIHFDYAK